MAKSKQNNSDHYLHTIKLRKAEIEKRCAMIEKNFISDVVQPQALITDTAINFASDYLGKTLSKNSQQAKKGKILNFIQKKDKKGILNPVIDILSIPVINQFVSRTGKSFMRWQLFNLSVFLIEQAYHYYTQKPKKKGKKTSKDSSPLLIKEPLVREDGSQ